MRQKGMTCVNSPKILVAELVPGLPIVDTLPRNCWGPCFLYGRERRRSCGKRRFGHRNQGQIRRGRRKMYASGSERGRVSWEKTREGLGAAIQGRLTQKNVVPLGESQTASRSKRHRSADGKKRHRPQRRFRGGWDGRFRVSHNTSTR